MGLVKTKAELGDCPGPQNEGCKHGNHYPMRLQGFDHVFRCEMCTRIHNEIFFNSIPFKPKKKDLK